MTEKHAYRVCAWWTSGPTGLAKCDSAMNAIHFSESDEYCGLAGRWTPEQLLLSALAACFTTTFATVARKARFSYTDLEVEVLGNAAPDSLECSLSEILIRPRLTVLSDRQVDQGLALLQQTESLCLLSQAVSLPQTTELRVEVGHAPFKSKVAETAVRVGV
jgi:organic hydroperoxide reductase OsmC/OhrA